MPDLIAVHQHCAIADVVSALSEVGSQLVITAAIANHQVGHSPKKFAALGKMPAERATAVVNEYESHGAHSGVLREFSAADQPIISAVFVGTIEAQDTGDAPIPALFGSFS